MLAAQDLTCLSVNDLREVRKIIADREFYKASFEEAQKQNTALVASRDSWKALFESEKNRADNIQGGRVAELQAEVKDARGALQIAKDQMADDRVKIGEQSAEIISLKSSRKWYFGFGLATGAVAGYYVARNQDRIVQAATGSFAERQFVQNQKRFGVTFKF